LYSEILLKIGCRLAADKKYLLMFQIVNAAQILHPTSLRAFGGYGWQARLA